MNRFLSCTVARCLNLYMLALLPKKRRLWGQALIAEQSEMGNSYELLLWAAGGVTMGVRGFLANLFDSRWTWVAGSVLGLGAALLDLHSTTRWPYLSAVCAIALMLTLLQPKWAWRWALLAALYLPTFVLLSDNWGPYRVDRFDVFYGLVPAVLGTLLGMALRRTAPFRRPPPASRGAAV